MSCKERFSLQVKSEWEWCCLNLLLITYMHFFFLKKKWISTWHSVQVKVLSVIHVAWKELWVSHRKKMGVLLVFPDGPKDQHIILLFFCYFYKLNRHYCIVSLFCNILFPSRSSYNICFTVANTPMCRLHMLYLTLCLEISFESLYCIGLLLTSWQFSFQTQHLIPSSQ